MAPGPFHTTPIVAASAEGATITDVDGNTFLDFACGIGVTNLGHGEPSVVAAAKAQADKFFHTSINVVAYEGYVEVAKRLNERAPGEFPKKTFLANSGAEAVENAIKFARTYTKRQAVICFEHAFHGRTYMAMALTGKANPYKSGFGPFPSEIYRAPFPDFYRWPGLDGEAPVCPGKLPCTLPRCLCREAFHAFEEIAHADIGETNVAAVIIEPVTGEGGFIPAPAPFLKMLREWCDKHGAVLIFDEIQTGFGRTGTLFACEQSGVTPDLLVLAKGLANGLPLSAVVGKAEVIDAVGVGGVGGTYCGNPVACAAALAVLDKFDQPETLEHARKLGRLLQDHLESWFKKFPRIGQIRGLGPMRAMELVKDRKSKEPDKPAAAALVKHNYENGLITLACGTHGNVLRFLLPLTATEEQLNEGLDVIEEGLAELG
ncbi:MAG: 4-aminobutyrate--2-oxoglutarate transaminase [Chthoniobacterales bacterium]|nr:4-aminobutyrate--2-oxoglutarate transaminase [Chthoniobacterales bacterium]